MTSCSRTLIYLINKVHAHYTFVPLLVKSYYNSSLTNIKDAVKDHKETEGLVSKETVVLRHRENGPTRVEEGKLNVVAVLEHLLLRWRRLTNNTSE